MNLKWTKALAAGEENFIAVVLVCSTGVLFMNVVLRYFFKMSTIWAEEFIRYSMIWISFIGSAVCFRKGIHFGVDLILRVKSKSFVRAVKIFIEAVCLAFCCFLLKYSVDLVLFSKGTGQISPAMQVPLWAVYAVIPFSAALGAIYEAVRVVMLCAGGTPPSGLDPSGLNPSGLESGPDKAAER
ncbi:MAG: TRAP transporter small permease [Synergistaceae bacterium]|nr:TRAP transporter small permease [Synergistaceae bacterium]